MKVMFTWYKEKTTNHQYVLNIMTNQIKDMEPPMRSHILSLPSHAVREFHAHMMLAEERHKLSVSRQNFWKASALVEVLKSAFSNTTLSIVSTSFYVKGHI